MTLKGLKRACKGRAFGKIRCRSAQAPTKKKRRAKDQFAKEAVEIDLQRHGRLIALQTIPFPPLVSLFLRLK